MAEFCLECYNELNGTHFTEKDVILEEDLCEGCGEYKPTIVVFRSRGLKDWLARINNWLEDYAWKCRYKQWEKEDRKGGPRGK